MRILVIGDDAQRNELSSLFKSETVFETEGNPADFDVIIDGLLDSRPEEVFPYADLKNGLVISSMAKKQLAGLGIDEHYPLVGMNLLPGFINRPTVELTALSDRSFSLAEKFFASFDISAHRVKDRVGMVTPRVVLMIINEACYTVQEGTASMSDIDAGMKLGTNYPFGPFEWADKIGIKHVYEVLEAVYQDTHDERYKICPLLKTHYLLNKPFYA